MSYDEVITELKYLLERNPPPPIQLIIQVVLGAIYVDGLELFCEGCINYAKSMLEE